MKLDLEVPDHTTLSRRSRRFEIVLKPKTSASPIDLIIDSTGLSIVGQGEWAASKHGKRGKCGWRKLHVGVNEGGEIVAQVLTDGSADDAKTGVELIDQVASGIKCVIGDTAYDTSAIYGAAGVRGAEVVVPPVRRAVVSRSKLPLSARDKTVLRVNSMGRRNWKREFGYHRQGRVENTFFRYKQILGGKLNAMGGSPFCLLNSISCNAFDSFSPRWLQRLLVVLPLKVWGPRSVVRPITRPVFPRC
jgi:hypothetical protein